MSQQDNETTIDNSPSDTPDLTDATAHEEALADDPTGIRAELDAANRRAEEMSEAFLRARADFANYKRRNEEERESLRSVYTPTC